ncbi:MAG: ferredoxin oxidoreductase [Desulfurococcales archaeon]|nr:ferredoxin oxidoreductase [Desulfurococcales archaeon]
MAVQRLVVEQVRLALSSNQAVAYAVRDADVDVVAAYPITPQTTVMEKISEMIANGEMDAELIHVESEHSALSAVVGASAAGARVFTATSSQGLELMHEILHIASGLRLPVVMAVPTRALSAPISIWNDYSDLMNTRDASWVTLIASTAQEVYDTVIEAFRIAEDPRILLPVMIGYDGFAMSHTYEPVYIAKSPERIREFLPRRDRVKLDPDRPVTMGTITPPEWYYELKYQQVVAMNEALKVVKETDKLLGELLGRSYEPVETYMMDDAEIGFLVYGGVYGTLVEAIDAMRSKGFRVGAARLRLWRPFPVEDLVEKTRNLEKLIVVDRAISYGARIAGPVALEVISAYYYEDDAPLIASVIAGIGQRTITEDDFVKLAEVYMRKDRDSPLYRESIYWGVRGVEIK